MDMHDYDREIERLKALLRDWQAAYQDGRATLEQYRRQAYSIAQKIKEFQAQRDRFQAESAPGKYCRACGKERNGHFCSHCGTPAIAYEPLIRPQFAPPPPAQQPYAPAHVKKPIAKRWWFWVLVAPIILFWILFIIVLFSDDTPVNNPDPEQNPDIVSAVPTHALSTPALIPTLTPKPTSSFAPTPTPKPSFAPKPAAKLGTRENPAKVGDIISYEKNTLFYGADLEITMTKVIRGREAARIVKSESVFNSDPGKGKEYILAYFRIKNLENHYTGDAPVSINYGNFDLVSSTFAKDTTFHLFKIMSNMLDVALYEGGSAEGVVAFEADAGDACYAVLSDTVWFLLAEG